MKTENRKRFGEVVIPPWYIEVSGPVIFLAGPIRGAVNWQNEAIRYIRSRAPDLHISSPRRPELTQDDFSEAIFYEQADWEHFYLRRAAENGVILFWLAREEEHICSRAYAQTTRFELGEAAAIHHFANAKVVAGIEDGFTGAKYIRHTLSKKYPGIPICGILEKTCEAAIRLAVNNREEVANDS